MFENQDVAILNRLGKLQNSVNETENIVSSTSKETTSQEILATVKNSGGGGLLPVYVTGDPTPAHYEWSMSGCTPYTFQYGASVVYKGELHILGGSGNHFGHWKWDGENWLNVSILPYDFLNGTAVVYKDAIHILGGDGNMYGHYKWNGQEWVEEVLSFQAITKASAVVYNNEIHILSALQHIAFNGTNWYQVSTNTFGDYCKAVMYDNAIHVFYHESTYHYKWNGSSWTTLQPVERSCQGDVVVFNNQIHFISDFYHYVYNKSANTWTQKNRLLTSFIDGKAVLYKNQIHILGGSNISQLHVVWNSSSDTYTGVKNTLPKCFTNGNAIVHDGELHLFGADDDTYGHYKWNGTTLTYVSKMPYPVTTERDLFAIEYDNEIHLFYTYYHYKYVNNAWTRLTDVCNTGFNKIFICKNQLYYNCYKRSYNYCYVYEKDKDTWASANLTHNSLSTYSPLVTNGDKTYFFYPYQNNSGNPTYCYMAYEQNGSWSTTKVTTISTADGGADPNQGVAYVDNGTIYLIDYNGKRFKLQGETLLYIDTLPLKPRGSSVVVYNNIHTILCGGIQNNISQLVPVKPTYRAYNYILPKGTQIIGTSSMIPLSSNLKVVNETTLQVTETGEVALLVGDTDNDRRLLIKG